MGKKILLADDSITIQKVIELTFSDEDFEVITVGNGRLAIERIQEARPDMILCDIIMPEKDGYDVCDFVKKNPALAHIPVLLLAGAFEPFDQERAARVKSDGFLAKPFEPQTLIARVKELIGRAAAAPAAVVPPAPQPPPAPAAQIVAPESEEINFIPDEPFVATKAGAPASPLDSATLEEEFYPVVESPGEQTIPPDLDMVPEYEVSPAPFIVETPGEMESLASAPSIEQETAPAAAPYEEGVFSSDIELTPEVPQAPEEPAWSEPTTEMTWEDRAQASRRVEESIESPAAMFDEVFEEEIPAAPKAAVKAPPAPLYVEEEAAAPLIEDEPRTMPSAPVKRAAATPAPFHLAPQESFAEITPPEDEAPAVKSVAADVSVPKDMVAQIAQRVIGQISEKIVREIVWEVVPELAEVMIKKEIERLKAENKEP